MPIRSIFLGLATIVSLSGAGAVAGDPVYTLDVQLWNGQSLLTNPTFTVPANERAEIIVEDPRTVKIALMVRPEDARSDQPGVLIDSEIFLDRGGHWVPAADSALHGRAGERLFAELPVHSGEFFGEHGESMQTLQYFVRVTKAQ